MLIRGKCTGDVQRMLWHVEIYTTRQYLGSWRPFELHLKVIDNCVGIALRVLETFLETLNLSPTTPCAPLIPQALGWSALKKYSRSAQGPLVEGHSNTVHVAALPTMTLLIKVSRLKNYFQKGYFFNTISMSNKNLITMEWLENNLDAIK
jgi:hypothetical protein